jgi:hypothetical protein
LLSLGFDWVFGTVIFVDYEKRRSARQSRQHEDGKINFLKLIGHSKVNMSFDTFKLIKITVDNPIVRLPLFSKLKRTFDLVKRRKSGDRQKGEERQEANEAIALLHVPCLWQVVVARPARTASNDCRCRRRLIHPPK